MNDSVHGSNTKIWPVKHQHNRTFIISQSGNLTYLNTHGQNLMNTIYVKASRNQRHLLPRLVEKQPALFYSRGLTLLSRVALGGGLKLRTHAEFCRINFWHLFDSAQINLTTLLWEFPMSEMRGNRTNTSCQNCPHRKVAYARRRQNKWLK